MKIFITILLVLSVTKAHAQFDYQRVADSVQTLSENYKYVKSIEYLVKVIQQCDECADSDRSQLYVSLGRMYILSEKYSYAYEAFDSAIKYAKKSKNNIILANALINLAEHFRNRGRYQESRNQLKIVQGLINRGLLNDEVKGYYYSRFAAVLNENGGGPDSVLMMSEKAAFFARKTNNQNLLASSMNEMAFVYEHHGKVNQSLAKYKDAIQIWIEIDQARYAANACYNLSRAYSRLGLIDSTLQYINLSISICDTNSWASVLKDSYFLKLAIHESRGQKNEAFEAQRNYYHFLLLDKERNWNKEMAKVTGRLNLTQKEKELNLQKRKQLVVQNKLDLEKTKRSNLFIFLFILIVILGSTLFFAARYYRSNNILNALLQDKELLLKEVHHRVKNNMQVVSSMLEIQESFVSDKSAQKAISNSIDRLNSLAIAHQRLYQSEDYNSINIKDYISDLVSSLCPDNIEVTLHVHSFYIEIEKAQTIGFITNELILNSIEHAWEAKQSDKDIVISLHQEEGTCFFNYSDNGKGISSVEDILESPTFGVSMIKLFVTRHLSGSIKIQNSVGVDVIIKFDLE